MSETPGAWEGEEALPGSESLLQYGKGALAEIQISCDNHRKPEKVLTYLVLTMR